MDELICKICNQSDCKCSGPETYSEAGWDREPPEPSSQF